MSLVIFLDSSPLALVTNPNKANAQATACTKWLIACLDAGARVCVPEICDYELRRELLRAKKAEGLARLDQLKQEIEYVPVTSPMMLRAAEFWARARQMGKPTASKEALDIDVILAAQATLSAKASEELVVATTNVGHLILFVDAKPWEKIAAK